MMHVRVVPIVGVKWSIPQILDEVIVTKVSKWA